MSRGSRVYILEASVISPRINVRECIANAIAPITPGPLPYDHKSPATRLKNPLIPRRRIGYPANVYPFTVSRDNLPRSLADDRFFRRGVKWEVRGMVYILVERWNGATGDERSFDRFDLWRQTTTRFWGSISDIFFSFVRWYSWRRFPFYYREFNPRGLNLNRLYRW